MRNVIVTGGSRGLGLGIARRLAGAGYRVIAIGRNENPGLMAAIEEAKRDSLQFVQCDLAELGKIQEMIRGLRKQFGPVYGLVNNAGISFDGPLATMPLEQMEQLVRVNTLSPMVVTKCVVRSMMADGEGRIINMASVVASTGYSGLAVYGATKASVVGFTRSLAREVGRFGINVNAVAPGFVETDMTHEVREEQLGRIRRRSALKRLPGIDDVASTVEFLLSDGSKNITGTVITVDAGNSA
ncbi:MAG: SDR family NAD(P)-dependent oxidoreductase [Acidobacteriaceae bacterium]